MIIVTGATGFIGSALVWALNKNDKQNILCVDTVPVEKRPGLLDQRAFESFISETELLKQLPHLTGVTAILHMGACSSTTEMDRDYLRRNNTEYTQTLFEWCTKQDIPFIYASSGAVYGDGKKGFDDFADPERYTALNPYGESKLNFDRWVVQQTETPSLWMGLRFFNVYGPHEYYKGSMASVVFKAFHQIKENGNLKLFRSHHADYKDGEQLRDFVYVKDITRWILEILDRKDFVSGIYNMGFGQARSWIDLANAVFKELGQKPNIEWMDIPEELRQRYQYFTEAKMDRFQEQGFSKPQWSLEDGVKDYVSNYLSQEHRYL